MNFDNNTFWITGAASGMGRSVAIEISKSRARLIISDRDAAGLNATASIIKNNGSEVITEVLDMSDSNAIKETSAKVLDLVGRIDGLYQFAGISQRSLVIDTPIENDHRIMEINYFGVIALAKAVLPSMIAQGGGQLAVTSSLVGKFGFPLRSAYSASKHALHGYFESLLAENSKNNIRVSILIPGRIQTNISKFALDKEGKEYGKMDEGQANGISAEKAARQICRGLRKEKNEVLVGGKELMMLYIRRFFPSVYYKLAVKLKPT
ncbi:MAG: SDR family NAD(P)-dependent oxidoreductase [Bacteroidales bacterium]|nr:SDR family NAD(P)-dependent oxidoreductase [Bacteroidales bacterium]